MAIHSNNQHSGQSRAGQPMLEEINAGGTDSILASMFRQIMVDRGINMYRWNQLMNEFLLNPLNGFGRNNKDQSSARGNTQKELFKRKMTWKVFCKALRFLNVVKFDFVIRTTWPNGYVTEHKKTVSLRGPIESDNEKDEDETQQ